MENKIIKALILVIVLLSNAYAREELMRPLSVNPHIKLINYSKDHIHVYVGFYGYESTIVFEQDESITQILMGVSTGWQLQNLGNRLGLKPIEDNADTNATIFTNKRIYHFKFHAKEATSINDPEIAYEVRFQYPSRDITTFNSSGYDDATAGGVSDHDSSEIPDISTATNLNFNYKVSGSDSIKPIKAFDDGNFTYLEFSHANAELPAIFLVDSEGNEALINFRVRGNNIIIERVAEHFTLRNGEDTVCLINKQHSVTKNKKKRRKSLFGR